MVQLTPARPGAPAGPDVLAAVRAAFPGLAWARADYPEQGLDHHVAILSGVAGIPGRAGASDTTIVARLATAPGIVGRADVEARILAAVDDRAPATVPRALATDGDSLTLARHIPGVALSAEVWAGLGDAHRHRISAQLAGTLDAIHGLDPDGTTAGGVGHSWFPVKHSALTRTVRELLLPVLDAGDAALTRKIMADAEAVFIDAPVPPRLIHGDLHETHLRWNGAGGDRPAGGLGVIDFSDMTVADPAIDVAHLAGISRELHARVISELAASDPDLERRAGVYSRWDAVFLMADHLRTGRTPETTARALFGRALESIRGR